MIGDYEYLYMIRQRDEDALTGLMAKYDRLLWKRAYNYFNTYHPKGIEVEDLYQEGLIALYESFYKYDEDMGVGLAHFVDICVSTSMGTLLRKCRGKGYSLLDTSNSLDRSICEDGSLTLYDILSDDSIHHDPRRMSIYYEAQELLESVLLKLEEVEVSVYKMYHDGYSYNEIAEKCELTPKKVDNILQKVRLKISEVHYTLD